MHCYLHEYLAFKRLPIVGQYIREGRLLGMTFREPAWNVVSVLVDFGRILRLEPDKLFYAPGNPPEVRLRDTRGELGALNGGGRPAVGDVDADDLLGCRVMSSRDDAVGGRIADLLINLDRWRLRYFVIDNRARRVLLDVSWITGISTEERCVITDGLPSDALATAPEYAGLARMTPGFEDTIYRHYTHRDFA